MSRNGVNPDVTREYPREKSIRDSPRTRLQHARRSPRIGDHRVIARMRYAYIFYPERSWPSIDFSSASTRRQDVSGRARSWSSCIQHHRYLRSSAPQNDTRLFRSRINWNRRLSFLSYLSRIILAFTFYLSFSWIILAHVLYEISSLFRFTNATKCLLYFFLIYRSFILTLSELISEANLKPSNLF